MRLVNARNGLEITKHAKLAASFWDRFLGLINPNNPRILIFDTRFGIHTFFLKKAIDVLVLDSDNKITVMKNNLQPFRFFFYNPRYSKVIELPLGFIKQFLLLTGDQILFS